MHGAGAAATNAAAEDGSQPAAESGDPTGRQVLRILGKRRRDLTAEDLRTMRKVVDRVHAQQRDDLEPTAGQDSWRRRLMSPGHDPLKPARAE